MTESLLPALDPHSPDFLRDPFPTYAMLREDAPVYEIPSQPGLFFITPWHLVREALLDPQRFSSLLPPARRTQPPPEVAEEVEAIRAQGFAYIPALGTNDPPVHTRYRKLVNRAFTVRSLAWMEPLVDEVADSLTAALPDGELVDIMDALTIPLPVWAILRILGMDDYNRDDLRRWSDSANRSLGGRLTAEQWLQVERDNLEFQQVMSAELDRRRESPGDDLLSRLVTAEDGEKPLTNQELVWLVRELVVAGNETTVRTLADIIINLDGIPGSYDRLRDDEAFRRGVTEEGIRFASPVMGLFRRTTCDVEVAGVTIPENSTVFLAYGAANRDPAVFEDPDAFDPLRENVREHLAFGHGIHVCVGAGLARIEIESALRALGDRVASLEVVDADAVSYGASYALRGPERLPVIVHRR